MLSFFGLFWEFVCKMEIFLVEFGWRMFGNEYLGKKVRFFLLDFIRC